MEGTQRRIPLGQLLVNAGFITEVDLARALGRQKRTGEPVGDLLLTLGRLTEGEKRAILYLQRMIERGRIDIIDSRSTNISGLLFGELLVAAGAIDQSQLDHALSATKESKRSIGDELAQHGYLSKASVRYWLRVQQRLYKAAIVTARHQSGNFMASA